ncbi:MAG: Ca-activated chloride channel family protein [Pseudohongiellaceae bacterium]|jgi:Ca-activated chloride channel family protein
MMSLLNGETAFELQWPWLLLLLPLPWIVTFKRKIEAPSYIAPHLPIFETAKSLGFGQVNHDQSTAKWKNLILLLAWFSLVIAVCRPTYIGDQVDIPLSGRDLMLAIDISPSMEEKDMQINGKQVTRLKIVQKVVTEFVENRSGDRVGLILFGSQPYVQSPLSFDTVTVNTLLQEAYLGMAGNATAIGDALTLGVKRLRQRPQQSRVLILLSDGANTAGEIPPEKAAQFAANENIKIYTVGIGADEMIQRDFFGSRKVNPSADLDEEMLKQLADLTGGQYFRAKSSQELTAIYQVINELEPVEQETRSFRPTKALFYWFVCFSMLAYGTLIAHNAFTKLYRTLRLTNINAKKRQEFERGKQ